MRKITTFEYRDNASPSVHLPASTDFSMPTYNRKSSRFESSSRAELGSILHPMASRDDGHYEYAINASQTFANELPREEHVQNLNSRSPRHRGESQDTMLTRVDVSVANLD